ncbi:MAG TPA: S9 family peptidase [Pyrinomonadaceae bacterium]|nr:S9 family peptidase [Chloracidobacterium sp.]HRJ88474.1 S9 family peptidase [Pyrinomonadaceae bacterium]HRK50585.1 S9 family peptidase [Pyrinomonadaceae bacterium]
MKRLLSVATLAIIACTGTAALAQNDMKPPVAKKDPKVLKIHGYEITDNYAWLRDRNEKKNPEIIKYLEDENAYVEAHMGKHKPFVDALYKEMLGRIKQTDLSVPYKLGRFWYFTRVEEGKQYPTFLRSKTQDGKDAEILLDQNEMAKGYTYFSIGAFEPSDDGNLLAFSTDTTGYRQYTLQVKDLRTGAILRDKIERVTSIEWSSDGKYLFFGQEDPVSKRTDKIFRHELGSDKNDLVFEDKDVLFNVGIGRSRDRKMFFINSGAATMNEFRYMLADNALGEWRVITPRREGHEYSATFNNGEFYIVTNKDAENFKVVRASVADPGEANWKDYIPHNPAVKIEGISFFRDHAVVSELENGLEYLRVMDMKTRRASARIETPESVYTMGLANNPEYDTPVIRYGYSSMITPNTTFEFDFRTRQSKAIKQQEIPSGYDKSQYETVRVWADARDGVKVPVSIMMKKGTKLDGKSPMLLYAYGSYGASMTPNFSTARLSLVDRGMIYAIAHIRGGSELGEKWRQDGRMFKKMNTFNDFVDCSKWLIAKNYTSTDRLVIQGGSAGGLLMGAVMNQAPHLYKAAIVQVPFVDVMNTMLDETLPLTTGEWIEWGNPNEKEAWDYMIQYSPYENIKAQAYPNMLIEVSLNDSQVPYWEGAKYAARLRELKTDKNIVLLKTNMGAGHGGSSGRYDRLKEVAFDYAYALTQVGITK